jgi:hypothetical protein
MLQRLNLDFAARVFVRWTLPHTNGDACELIRRLEATTTNDADIIAAHSEACLETLKQSVSRCPESMWNSADHKTDFWHVAYHGLFFTHFRQDPEHDLRPWSKHRPEYQFIGQLPWPPHAPPAIGGPYEKDTILSYLAFCQKGV